jgi:hypothetical protein
MAMSWRRAILASLGVAGVLLAAWVAWTTVQQQITAEREQATADRHQNQLNQRETTAKGIWREYLRLAIEYPKFADGKYEENETQYTWFLAYLLWGSEEILEFDEASWKENVKVNLEYHRRYFRKPDFMRKELPLYSAKVKELVTAIVQRQGDGP